jgi:hypothetical protein
VLPLGPEATICMIVQKNSFNMQWSFREYGSALFDVGLLSGNLLCALMRACDPISLRLGGRWRSKTEKDGEGSGGGGGHAGGAKRWFRVTRGRG